MNAEILLSVAVLIILAKIFGEFCEKYGLSVLLGELFAGILVGPFILYYCFYLSFASVYRF